MGKVARSSQAQVNRNKLRVHRVKLYFQLYPGTKGKDKERGIGSEMDVEYELYIDQRFSQKGVIGKDGSIEMLIPSSADVELYTLGSVYKISPYANLAPHDTVLGAQQRLRLLGYFTREPDDEYDAEFDRAVLNYQADHGLRPVGYMLDQRTYDSINSYF